MVPLYVGMTAMAAYKKGNALRGRIVDRLIRFPKVFQEYKIKNKFILCKRKTGTCGFFDLFDFPERIRIALSKARQAPNMTLEEAETVLIEHPDIIDSFGKEYRDSFYYNVSISFVEFIDEREMFYSEALAIGLLRPWLNHS